MKEGFLEAAEYGQIPGRPGPPGAAVPLPGECLLRGRGHRLRAGTESSQPRDRGRHVSHEHRGRVLARQPDGREAVPAHVHFADSNRWYPGAGHINFREVLEALRLIGYDRFITMEMEQQPDSSTAARRAIQTVRALLDAL